MIPQTRIVAEVSKNWPEVEPGTLAQRFEQIIETNQERGYVLESWQLNRMTLVQHTAAGLNELGLNETIIAVFVHKDTATHY